MTGEITVRSCVSLVDFHACVALQREIWGEQDLEVEPATLFVVAHHTGGQVLGAFADGTLIGYTLALPGIRDGRPYLHSHMTGVHAHYRDRGVGRLLKLFQRDQALGRGIRIIEWTFDPLELRNAHFNLNRLGAVSRRYLPNLYGITTSPLHRGLATDRLVAEWYLDSPRVEAAIAGKLPELLAGATVEIPSFVSDWKPSDLERVQAAQTAVSGQFTENFARAYAAVGVVKTPTGGVYQLAPWSEF